LKLIFLLLLICSSAIGQVGEINGHINLKDSTLDYKYILVYVLQKDTVVSTLVVNDNGDFKIHNLKYGNYTLKIELLAARDYFQDFSLNSNSIFLNIDYPTCSFAKSGKKPKCPFGHSDNIIPTVYGLPNKKMINKAEKGIVHLGGCEMYADCNSYFFCKIHSKAL